MASEITFTQPWDQGDVAFKVEGRYIYGNKTIMSMWSPVFKAMFGGAFKESKAEVVELPGKRYVEILQLIRVLHPPSKPIDNANVTILLPLAHEYQIDGLTKHCEEFLLRQEPSVPSLVLAEKFSLMTLKKKCLQYANGLPLITLRQDRKFNQLSEKTRSDLFGLLAEKATRYEQMLDEVASEVVVVSEGIKSCIHFFERISSCPSCAVKTIRLIVENFGTDNTKH